MSRLHIGDTILVTKQFNLNGKVVACGSYRIKAVGNLEFFWRNHFYRTGIELFGKHFETYPEVLCGVLE